MQKIRQLCDLHGPGGEDRRKMIKLTCHQLIENIMPGQTRAFLHIFSNSSNATDDQYEKLFKTSKYTALTKLKEGDFSKIDEIFYNAGVSHITRRRIINRSSEFVREKSLFESIVHDIIRLRNRLLDAQKGFHTRN